MPYAIINRRNDKFVYGTDFRHYPPHQQMSRDCMLVYESRENAVFDMACRRCGKDYEVVEVEVTVK